jgi:hypothetical protein
MIEPVTSFAVTAYSLKLAVDFAKTVGGPAARELGLFLAEEVKTIGSIREAKRMTTLARAAEMVKAAGFEPQQIPRKILVPILEGASLEDDPDLTERWAALLANASREGAGAAAGPRFPYILQQISPLEALILDYLRSHHADQQKYSGGVWLHWFGSVELIGGVLQIDGRTVLLACDNLTSLGITQREPTLRKGLDGPKLDQQSFVATDGKGTRLSELGLRFLEACTKPSSAGASHDDK